MNSIARFFNVDVKRFSSVFLLGMIATFLAVNPAFADGLASLEKATTALQDILSWLKVFVVVASVLYITYLVVMAIAEKKSWSDVMMGLVYCAIAGGVVMGGEWASELWN